MPIRSLTAKRNFCLQPSYLPSFGSSHVQGEIGSGPTRHRQDGKASRSCGEDHAARVFQFRRALRLLGRLPTAPGRHASSPDPSGLVDRSKERAFGDAAGVLPFIDRSATASDRFACSAVSQFPTRTPIRRTPLTRRIPAASSGLRRPESAASNATWRTAAKRRMMVAAAYCFCSRKILYRRTTVRLNARRGSEQILAALTAR
jgi:hypothetical protein